MRVKITPELLANPWQKAKAAMENSEGQWAIVDGKHTGGWGLCVHDRGDIVARSVGRDQELKSRIFSHIAAASPAVVLALVAEVERLRNKLDDLECPNCGNQPKFCMCDEQLEASQ
jgi:hypothetical protein